MKKDLSLTCTFFSGCAMSTYLLFMLLLTYSVSASFLTFKCTKSSGRTTGLLPMIQSFGTLTSAVIPTARGVSAIQCAALCARTSNVCQSYSYDHQKKYCFTENIRADHTGYLCGTTITESRQRCQQFGSTMVAYGGPKFRMVECICGGDSNAWMDMQDFLYNACPDVCKDSYPCGLDLYPSGRCRVCNGTLSACNGIPVKGGGVGRIICMTFPI